MNASASRRAFVFAAPAAAVLLGTAASLAAPSAAAQTGANRALFQVSDNDPQRWNIILNNLQNLRDGVGGEPVEIELVAYGPGILMMKADSPVRSRVEEAIRAGVTVNVCQNTMGAMKLQPSDMLPQASYVPSGVVEVMRKQQKGWAYIRS